jgi:signal transduction histidine kinase
MHFRVAARTILQLGAELISSDEIAFYELIKNAIDAQAEEKRLNEITVEISIVARMKYEASRALLNKLISWESKDIIGTSVSMDELRAEIFNSLSASGDRTDELLPQLMKASSYKDMIGIIEESNYIDIKDSGEGMSQNGLKEIYLTIGTRSRQKQREKHTQSKASKDDDHRLLLGEKGVGRLSVMRLGRRLRVKTTKKGESHWNILEVDWSRFSHSSDEYIDQIEINPYQGEVKRAKSEQGTIIHISGLTSGWDESRIRKLLEVEFSKFTDPFNPKAGCQIEVDFNGNAMSIPVFDKSVLKHAHAVVKAEFTTGNNPRLKGNIDYRLRAFKKSFSLEKAELRSAAKVESLDALVSLGPFKVEAYWFNRRLLNAASGVPNFQEIRDNVKKWAGGLMLYRDGFRVKPYGDMDDDWLDLDQKALASGGYKVNRRQIIGKVDISSLHNSQLIDQTNREGLRSSDEKQALVRILKHILETEMRVFLNYIDKQLHEESLIDLDILKNRVKDEVRVALKHVQLLVAKYPEVRSDVAVVGKIHEAFKKIEEGVGKIKEQADAYKSGHDDTVHLAGLGLLVEFLAHELNRAASNAIDTLDKVNSYNLPREIKGQFLLLDEQMKSLRKRLQFLDPLSTNARQKKETFELVSWVKEIITAHKIQFDQYHIKTEVNVVPGNHATLRFKGVKGMIVQVLENLISNSVYWLNQQYGLDKNFPPRINIVIDTELKEIIVTDNGPGVEPKRKEEIFLPFVTMKPSGDGKGLGLYIAREIATYHDAELFLSETPTIHPNRLNTFVFALERRKK